MTRSRSSIAQLDDARPVRHRRRQCGRRRERARGKNFRASFGPRRSTSTSPARSCRCSRRSPACARKNGAASSSSLRPPASRATPYVAPYVAAKHGVVGLMRALALETAKDGITVNAVCPGYTETPMLEQAVGAHRRDDQAQRGRSACAAGGQQSARPFHHSRRKSPTRCCGCAPKGPPASPARPSRSREARHGERAAARRRGTERERQQGAAAAVDQAVARQPADRRRGARAAEGAVQRHACRAST